MRMLSSNVMPAIKCLASVHFVNYTGKKDLANMANNTIPDELSYYHSIGWLKALTTPDSAGSKPAFPS